MNIEEEKLIYLNTKYDEEQLKYIYQNNLNLYKAEKLLENNIKINESR